jgi:hypothetical protein
MTVPLIFLALGILALIFIVVLAKGQLSRGGNLGELASRLRPIDVEAFRNLIDEGEEDFLRERLTAREFRSIYRERMLAAAEYVWCASQNAGILTRLAEAARQDQDPATTAAAEKLLDNALRLRLYAFRVVPRLYLAALLPWAACKPIFVADTYDTITRQYVMLGCLQYSAREASPSPVL